MKTYWLQLELLSDDTFGRGDGVAGVVEAEVQHDEYGLPYLGGKTLKGLLGAECAEILHALDQAAPEQKPRWQESARRLFGYPGSDEASYADMHVGAAQLPEDLRAAVANQVRGGKLSREEVLSSLTVLRRQTAMDPGSGAPQKETLRTVRVILRETPFAARLDFAAEPKADDLALLAACVKAFRRAGTERNRGRGALQARLFEQPPGDDPGQAVTETLFDPFRKAVLKT